MAPKSKDGDYAQIADPVLLERVDRLFACNVGELIDLSQLVVVGDQISEFCPRRSHQIAIPT